MRKVPLQAAKMKYQRALDIVGVLESDRSDTNKYTPVRVVGQRYAIDVWDMYGNFLGYLSEGQCNAAIRRMRRF